MDENYIKGLKIGLGIISIFGIVFGIVFAIGFHSANEITSGSFIGNFNFSSATVYGLNSGIEKSSTSICNAENEGNLRYNPTTVAFEGCYANSWTLVKSIQWNCDYIINGNCWSEVWRAPSDNLNSNSYSYTNSQAVSEATAFAFGYVDSSGTLSQTYYTNNSNVITSLKANHPLNYPNVDTTITIYNIDTGVSSGSGILKYGYYSWGANCADVWAAGSLGRLCFTGLSTFPQFTQFNNAAVDYCVGSGDTYNIALCTSEKRLIILAKI